MHDAMIANRIETVDYFRSTQNYRLNTLITLRLSLHRTALSCSQWLPFCCIAIAFPVANQTVLRHFGTGPELSRHFRTIIWYRSFLVLKCLVTAKCPVSEENVQKFMSPSVKFYMKGSNSLVCKVCLVNLHM